MKRLVCLLLAAVALCAGMSGTAAGRSPNPMMEITAGFDGYCRANAWCPVHVVLANEGADIEGTLRILVPSSSGAEPDVYSQQVVLPTHSRKACFVYIPSAESPYRSRLTVEWVVRGKALVSKSATVTWIDERDRLYGVISSDPSALNFLGDVAPATGEAMVARLSLEALPPDPLGWEALDVLILNDVDTSALGDEQRYALETWVTHGGYLIVGGGAGATRTVVGVADLLPSAVTGVRQIDELTVLGDLVGAPVSTGPYAVAEVELRDGVALVEQGDLILLARRLYGAGQVDFLAFDAGLNPFTGWDANLRLWQWIVGAQVASATRLTVRNGYSAQAAIAMIPGLRVPSALEVLMFMLLYVLLIGPVNYLVLRKLDRRELAWLTIPLIILGFTFFVCVTGFNVRGGTAILHQMGLVVVPPGLNVGRVSEVVGLFSPRRARYDVRVTNAEVRVLPPSEYPGEVQPLHVVKEGDGSTVTGLRVNVGGIQSFLAEGYVDAPDVKVALRLVTDDTERLWLEGDVYNGGTPLKETVLIVGDSEQRLGDLDAGEQVHVRLLLQGVSLSSDTLVPARILGPGDYWRDRELYRRVRFLQAFFYDVPLPPGAYLMAWVEEDAVLPVEVVGRPASTHSLALYVYRLPVRLEVEAGSVIPPALTVRQVDGTVGYVSVAGDSLVYMEPGSQITFRFTVWPETIVRRVDGLVLDMRRRAGTTSGPPAVSVWDWKGGTWDRQVIEWGTYPIPQADRYVSSKGEVLVRLETERSSVTVESLTITIRGQR